MLINGPEICTEWVNSQRNSFSLLFLFHQEKYLSSIVNSTEENLILSDKDMTEEQNVSSLVETIHLSAFSDNEQGESSTV
ncbi:hypothetical protein F8M41_014267 [Gigaspora margarita]|uniref:Uncharacterized protein n=1 Tax=Gigaspora margarita TaxID=4874 RepID=A0A8H4ARU3_GIGMA|nr:hypothetical protein F8M41_014267 [Gigaspora margarita]